MLKRAQCLLRNPLIAAVLVFAFVKKLLSLALPVGLVLALYVGYLLWSRQKVPEIPEDLLEKGKKAVQKVEDTAEETLKETLQEQKEKLENMVG